MATVCISNCCAAEDTESFPLPRAKYVNLRKWPESDGGGEGQYYFLQPPRVVDSVSCRQLYLRSGYTFSRKETVPQKTKKCFGRVKEKVALVAATRRFRSRSGAGVSGGRRRRFVVVKRVKEFSCETLRSIFQRLLSCTTSVDVVERN